jgi:hypothetical protein
MAHLRSRLTGYACSGARTAAGATPPIFESCVQTSGSFTSQEEISRASFCADRDRSCVHALTTWLIGLRSCRSLPGACLNSKMYGQAFRDGKDHLVVKDSWLLFGAPAFRLSTNAGHPFRFYLSDRVDLIFWFCSGPDASRPYSSKRGISRAVRRRLFVFANKNTNATGFDNGPS